MGTFPDSSVMHYFVKLIPPGLIDTIKTETMKKFQKKVWGRQYWNEGEFEQFIAVFIIMQVHPTWNLRNYFYDKDVKWPFITDMFTFADLSMMLSSWTIFKRPETPEVLNDREYDECGEEECEESEEPEHATNPESIVG